MRRGAVATLLLTAAVAAVACTDDTTAPSLADARYGASQTPGGGTARTYVTLDAAGKPTSMGVAMSEAALTNLPMTPNASSPSAVMLQLALPTDAPVAGYDHVMLDWNPLGHEPDHVYPELPSSTVCADWLSSRVDGKFIFLEPMITKAYLESLKNTTGMTRPIGTAAQVASAGYYPSRYSIQYDSAVKEFRISLENLVYRQ